MDAAAELERNPVSTRFSLSVEMSRLTRDGTAEPVSRDQIIRRERGQGKKHFPCSGDHEQGGRCRREALSTNITTYRDPPREVG